MLHPVIAGSLEPSHVEHYTELMSMLVSGEESLRNNFLRFLRIKLVAAGVLPYPDTSMVTWEKVREDPVLQAYALMASDYYIVNKRRFVAT